MARVFVAHAPLIKRSADQLLRGRREVITPERLARRARARRALNATYNHQSNLHDREEQPARVVVDPHADGGLLALALEAERDGGVVAQVAHPPRVGGGAHVEADARAGGTSAAMDPSSTATSAPSPSAGPVEAEGALDEVDRAAAERGAADEAEPADEVDRRRGAAGAEDEAHLADDGGGGGERRRREDQHVGPPLDRRRLRAPALSGLNDGPPAEGVGRAGS